MPPVRSPRLLALTVAAAAVLPVLTAPPATAEEAPAAGDTVVGELVQGYADPAPAEVADDAHEDDGTLLSWVRSDDGEAVRVPTEDVEDVEAGSTVEVVLGEPVADEATAEGLEPAMDVLASEVVSAPEEPRTAPATGAINHEVTVVMLQPAGAARDATTLAQVRAAVDGPVADFWAEQTDGAVRFGTVAGFDWPTEPSALTCADPFALWEEAATRAGWTAGPDKHLLVYVPHGSSGCSYGLGTIGTGSVGSGGLAYVRATATSLIAHEFGHNLGLGHASHLQCAGVVHGAACYIRSYYDMYDVMGVSWDEVGSLSAPHADLLGVLPAAAAPTLAAGAATTEFLLAPVGARTGTRAVRLDDGDGDVYWLEYRTATGRDAFLGTAANWPELQTGVLVRLVGGNDGENTSFLLDGTPPQEAWWPSDLAVAVPGNRPVSVGDAPFTVTVLEATASGARIRIAPHPIDAAYERLGGSAVLGEPTSARVCGLRDGGCRRAYAKGSLYWNPRNGRVTLLSPAVAQRYELLAGPTWLGYPLGDETDLSLGGTTGRTVSFPEGDIVWSPSTGAHVVRGAILARWREVRGALGFPLGGDAPLPGGAFTAFAGGSVYWSPATGPRLVRGAILERYVAAGGPGALGFPVADDGGTADGTGALVRLERGAVYWSSRTGAHVVFGAILARWRELGAQTGALGYPTSDELSVPGGRVSHFAGGSVYWSPATGPRLVRGAILERYVAAGGPGALGFPVADDGGTADGTGALVRLERGAVYWSSRTGAHVVFGAILARWRELGAQTGALGYPTSDELSVPGGRVSHFAGGSVYWSPDTGAHAVRGGILAHWLATGGPTGPLGFPVTGHAALPGGGGWQVRFQHGVVTERTDGRIETTTG
ncbi:hypothetical protein [Geodermatophilus sp. SYSU D01176]